MSLEVSIAYIGLRAFAGVLSVATMALLARAFGPTGFAAVAVAIAAALLVASTVFGPLHAALARFSDDRDGDRAALVSLFFRAALAVLLAACAIALSWTQHAPLVGAAAAFAIGQSAFDYAVQDATSSFEPRRVARLYLSKSLVGVAGAAVILVVGAPAWAAVAWLAVASALAVVVFGRRAFAARWMPLARMPQDNLRRLGRFAAPLALVSALVFCAQWADRAIVGSHLGAASFGAYVAFADLAQQVIGMLFSGVGAAWYPRLVEATQRNANDEVQRLFARYVELLWLLLLPAVIGFAAVAPTVAHIAFGAEFRMESVLWMPLLVLGAGLAGLKSFLFDLPHFLRRRMTVHACIVASVAALSTVAALLLVPRFGVTGAAAGYVAATLGGCALSVAAARGHTRFRPMARTAGGAVLAYAVMLAATLSTIGPTIGSCLPAIALGAASYGIVLWVLDVSEVRATARRAVATLCNALRR